MTDRSTMFTKHFKTSNSKMFEYEATLTNRHKEIH